MKAVIHESLAEVPAEQWNRAAGTANPFLRHEFLAALERHHCVGREAGWLPQHVALYGDGGRLTAAAPLYAKFNWYGEFVFDWAWADAYERAGRRYYPKLVAAVPYTPATGPRLLLAGDAGEPESLADALIEAAVEHARRLGVSSLHWLFPQERDMDRLARHGLRRRMGCQYHWRNPGYGDFADFLSEFSARKRKKINRERRRVAEADIRVERILGHEATAEQWEAMYRFYRRTFVEKGGLPTLTLDFFLDIAATMGEQILLVLARHGGRYVAGALNFIGADALYGRHWGAEGDFHSLHFELCYYQGIDFCIINNLSRFEPGAQGEYKISRGFLPTRTWSAHWIADPAFRQAIDDFLTRETAFMEQYIGGLEGEIPFRADARVLA